LVIGVNSAIATLPGSGGEIGSIGLGFAIPSNSARRIAEEIIATGESQTPIIGVNLDLTFDQGGAKIREVNAGGPAEDAGLRTGDVIVEFEGRSIQDATELVVAIRTYAPGDDVSIRFERDGRPRQTTLVLGGSSS
jgi:putative serine protease PepD